MSLTYDYTDNIGSITYLELIPLSAISHPGYAYQGKSVGFAYDLAKTLKIDFLPEQAGLTEKLKPNEPAGGKANSQIAFVIPQENEAAHLWINAYKSGRFVAITVDGNGNSRLTGTMEVPLAFPEINFSTEKSYVGLNRNEFVLSGMLAGKSLRLNFVKPDDGNGGGDGGNQTPDTSGGSGLPISLPNLTGFAITFTEPWNNFLAVESYSNLTGTAQETDLLEIWVKNMSTGQVGKYDRSLEVLRGNDRSGGDYDPIIPFSQGDILKIEYWMVNQAGTQGSDVGSITHVVGPRGLSGVFVDDADASSGSLALGFSPGTTDVDRQSDLVRFNITNNATMQSWLFEPTTTRNAGSIDLDGMVFSSGQQLKIEYWVVGASDPAIASQKGRLYYNVP